MDASEYFKGKKVTLMGLGLLGRGVGDARYVAECGAELIVTDLKTEAELKDSVGSLTSFPNIQWVLGEHRLEDFQGRDLILKAAGVPLDSVFIAEAKKHRIPVRMSADLFMELSGIPSIGVTGTRGKSTVTHMLHAILKEAGKEVVLGGNVRGVSTLALLPQVTPESVAVLELDSWQCQGLREAERSPNIAVFTTFLPDHTNYYKDVPEQYLDDKANIFLYQTEADTLVLGKQCAPTIIEKYGEAILAHTIVADEMKLPDTWTLAIPGMHNRYNAALALSAARAYNLPDDVIRRTLAQFTGVPGRLELVAEINGVFFYNDTTATTPEATLAALAALDPARIVLIMGGADKSLSMEDLVPRLPEVKKVLLLAGTGTDHIKKDLPEAPVFETLEEAFTEAVASANMGDSVLLSPAFASFGMFKNEFDRGDQFSALVEALKV